MVTKGLALVIVFVIGLAPVLPAAAADQAGSGLAPRADAWPRLQGRLSLDTAAPLWRSEIAATTSSGLSIRAASLLGDYYLTGSWFGEQQLGGLRATSGLLVGGGSGSFGGLGGRGFNLERRSRVLFAPSTDGAESSTLPYFGVGYTGLAPGRQWGFTADVGLLVLNPGPAVRLGRSISGWNSAEELMRELRLTPMVHLGVSYSF